MAVSILTSFPKNVVAGTTLKITLTDGENPASTHTGILGIVGNGIDKRAAVSADGDDHAFVFSADDTSSWKPGTYQYALVFEEISSNEREEADRGTFYVSRDLLADKPYVSENERMLAALLDYQAGKLEAGAAESWSIDGQSFTHTSTEVITRQIVIYQARVKLERDREKRQNS